MNEYIDPRSRLGRMRRDERARPRRSRGLRAYYRTLGVRRRSARCARSTMSACGRPRTRSTAWPANSSCGKTTLIKTIAAAIQPPLEVLAGSVVFNFSDRRDRHARVDREELAAIRWRHLSYIMQGSMSVLNPVRRVRHAFVDFAFRHIGQPMPEFLDDRARASGSGCISSPRCSMPFRTSSPAACARGSPSRSPPSAGPNSSSPTSRPRR